MFIMLTPDEVRDGTTFILQLAGAGGSGVRAHFGDGGGGTPVQWVETLRGETAQRWYEIYRHSDWAAVRAEAADVFHRRVSEAEAAALRKGPRRCVFIHTPAVAVDELAPGRGSSSS